MATGSLVTEALEQQFHVMSRAPFQKELARLLGAPPKAGDIEAFAKKYPDRWAQAVAIMSRLSGYTEKVEVQHTGLIGFAAKLAAMSDAEVELEHERRANEAIVTDAVVTEASSNSGEASSRSGVARSPATLTPKVSALPIGNSVSQRTSMVSGTYVSSPPTSAPRSLPMVSPGKPRGGLPAPGEPIAEAGVPTPSLKSGSKVPR